MSSSPTSPRRWWVLVLLAVAQMVVILDGTIINVALPQIQDRLALTSIESQWVIVAYALAFGALLLLGGRIADFWGRKRTFFLGLAGFGAASLIGGLAQNGTELVVARGLQGAFAALMAPAALALLTVTFPSGRDRNTAFAVFGAVGAAGAGVGMVLGGLLTEFADWRWCLLVNVPIVLITLIAGIWVITESRAEGDRHLDVLGTIVIVLGLASLVYGFTLAEHSWADVSTVAFLAAGVILIALFVFIESRVAHPLLPLRVVANRLRGGAFLLQALAGTATIGATVFLAFYLQLVLGLSPFVAGLATLPFPVVVALVAPTAAKILGRSGPRFLMTVGPLVAAAGMVWLSFVSADGTYWVNVLPGLILLGIGLSLLFVPLQNVALSGVADHDAGAASAVVTASGQIGGSLGLSIFSAVVVAANRGTSQGVSEAVALTNGYAAAFLATAIALFVGFIIALVLIRPTAADLAETNTERPSAPMH